MIEVSIIGTVLGVERDLNGCLLEIVRLWSMASSLGGVVDLSSSPLVHSDEVAESRVGNINFTLVSMEWSEVLTSKSNDISSFLWSSVWINHGNLWVVVVPEVYSVPSLLLAIKRY